MTDNTIFVGNKPFMNYVTAVVMQFSTHKAPEVRIQARGKFITRAVDVAEVARRKFLENVDVSKIEIGSEDYEDTEDKAVRVSTISIVLQKKTP